MKKFIFIVLTILVTINSSGQKLPYQNPELSSEDRAKDLMSRLTLKEKTMLMCDISEPIPRLGIRKFNWWSEALHGFTNNRNVTVFPEPVGMAASFDDALVYKVFTAVSDEIRAEYTESRRKGVENERFHSLAVWTPNINIFRDPRWGRGQETYGEDPYLMSRMGISVVKGLQGPEDSKYKKLLACAKHYAVHSGPEWSRHTININDISARELWETYLPAFKALVQDADVRQVMCAYQRLDDEPCCSSKRLLQRILREDWGYKYLVVSDCGAIADFYTNHKVSSDATHAAARASLAGTDVECGFGYAYEKLPEAVEKGLIRESDIDLNILRVLKGRFDLGEMDDDSLVPWSKIPMSIVNDEEHRTLALDMARETMTLLQNRNSILPLSKSVDKIAVIGPNADDAPMMWGNYNGVPVRTVTVLNGIKSKLPSENIFYSKGCDIVEDMITESLISECSIDGKAGIKATYWNNRKFEGDAVATDQIVNPINLTTAGQHEFGKGVHLKEFSCKYETVYQPSQSGEIVVNLGGVGRCELLVNGESMYNFNSWRPSPSRVPLKVEKGKEYKIEIKFIQEQDWTNASIKLNIGREIPVKYDALIEKLRGIDTVIFVGGISPWLEGEEMSVLLPGFKGGDRTDIELPASQRNFLWALKKAGKKIVFVNCSGSAISLVPETESCDAILQAWYGGESGGQAVADVLFGDYNPSGRLPITFYKNSSQLPDFEDYSMKGRTYRYMSDPLYPFGYGLSYTTFSIGSANASKTEIKMNDNIKLTIPVSNIGKRDGTEIVQVYVRKLNDTGGPLKTLRAFKRLDVAVGKTQNVTIDLPSTTFQCFDSSSNMMRVTAGEYELLYGTSSDDKDLKSIKITIQEE
ncbi:MAG: xylan 1,4-beta-xylosidase [Bacteroidota bacterium]|jgi:beta-glucosidase